jgi:NADPH2:quinone reductase
MKALVCHTYGPINSHRVRNLPDPVAGPGEVVVDVAYSTVNFPDTLIVQGLYQVKPPTPFVPGHECSGIISQVGSGVTNCRVGDRVFVSTGINGFAEKFVIASNRIRHIPEWVSLPVAATLGITYCTALHALKDCGHVKANEWVLVLGAAGGVGSAAIEIAKAMGARVIAAASTQEKLEYCTSIGADAVINYEVDDVRTRIKEITNNQGIDVVVDNVGGPYSETAFRSLAYRGRHLVIGFTSGSIPAIPLNLALLGERSITGVYVGAWSPKNPEQVNANNQQLFQWVKEEKLKPLFTKTFPLDSTTEALQYAAERKAMGKILIEVDSKLL